MSQVQTFNHAIKQLFFEVDINQVRDNLVDTFSAIKELNHNNETFRRINLNVALDLGVDEPGWSVTHTFNFTKSPLPNQNIKSGYVQVTIGETGEIKKLLDVRLVFHFSSKNEASSFFDCLKNIFEPLSTMNKIENDKSIGEIAQYSTRRPSETGIKNVSFIMTNSTNPKYFEISVSLLNRFIE